MSDLENNGYRAEGVLRTDLVMIFHHKLWSEAWEQIKTRYNWTCDVTGKLIPPSLCWRPCRDHKDWQYRRISDAGMRLIFGDSPMNIFCDREAAKRGDRVVQHVRALPSNKDKP